SVTPPTTANYSPSLHDALPIYTESVSLYLRHGLSAMVKITTGVFRAGSSRRSHPPPRHRPICPPRPDADRRVRRVAWLSPGRRHKVTRPAPHLSSTAPGWRSGSPSPGPRRPPHP